MAVFARGAAPPSPAGRRQALAPGSEAFATALCAAQCCVAKSDSQPTHGAEMVMPPMASNDESQTPATERLTAAVTVETARTKFRDKYLEASCEMLRNIAVFGALDYEVIAAVIKSSKRSLYSAGELLRCSY